MICFSTLQQTDYNRVICKLIVLVGITGSGKSSTGNPICGGTVFTTNSSDGQTSFECTKETADINGQRLSIVDTPGLFDHKKSNVVVEREIAKGVALAAPGPHVLLVVIQSDKYTNNDQEAVKIIQEMFGKEASRYTMVLFTHGDKANAVPIEETIEASPYLCTFIRLCGGYHVFNNRDEDPSQVRKLLEKIDAMVQRNGGSYYTSEMSRDTETDIQAEMEQLMREYRDMSPEDARRQAERTNRTTQGNDDFGLGFLLGFTATSALAIACAIIMKN